MTKKFALFCAGVVCALGAPSAQAAITSESEVIGQITLDGTPLAFDSDGPGSTASIAIGAGLAASSPDPYSGVVSVAAIVAGPVGVVGSYVVAGNLDSTGTAGTLQSDGVGQLSFTFFNDFGSAAHAYFDFALDQIELRASSPDPIDVGPGAQASLRLRASAVVDGMDPLPGQSILFSASASDLGVTVDSSFGFGSAVMNPLTNISCGFDGSAQTCSGGLFGTLDLGMVDPGQLLQVSLLVETSALAGASAMDTGTIVPVLASAIVSGNSPGSTCVNACTFGYLRLDVAAPVPEPASWALMIGGFGLAGGLMRRRPALRLARI